MASTSAGVSGIADRYATALFDLADERKALDQTAGDLKQLRAMVDGSPELRRLLRSPVLSRAEQAKAIGALAGKAGFSGLTRNFLGLVAQNRRLFAVPGMIEAFLGILAKRRGEVTAQVTTAQELTAAQRAALDEQLRRTVGAKVTVDVRIDPNLLGGMVVRVGSRMVDASLRTKLQRMQLAMKGV